MRRNLTCGAVVALMLGLSGTAAADILDVPANASILPSNDDLSSSAVRLGFRTSFEVDGERHTYNRVYVNNNGNLTFGQSLYDYTPERIGAGTGGLPIIAPFWADVDTHGPHGTVSYGRATVDGHKAFVATWNQVGYFSHGGDKRNTFQAVLIERPDLGAGTMEVRLKYRSIEWEAASTNGGSNGVCAGSSCAPARAGVAVGDTVFELAGSGTAGAFLDSNPNGLANRDEVVFLVRDGVIVSPGHDGDDDHHETPEVHEEAIAAVATAALRASIRPLLASLANRAMQMRRAGAGGPQSASVSGLSSGDPTLGIGVWGSAGGSHVASSAGAPAFSGNTFNGLFGIDKMYDEADVLVGVALSGERSDTNFRRTPGGLDSNGVTAVVYAAWLINEVLTLEGQVGYGLLWSDIDETRLGAPVSGEYDGNRFLANVSLDATKSYGDLTVSGRVGVSTANEYYDAYIASDGARVSPPDSRLNQVRAGLKGAYRFDAVEPYASATYEWDFSSNAPGDPNGALLEAGLNWVVTDQTTLGAFFSGEVLRHDQEEYSAGVSFRYAF